MKQIITILLICLTGMAVLAQDMSYFNEEFFNSNATFRDRREVLEVVRDGKITGIGEFYHNALKLLIEKFPDIKTRDDRRDTEESAKIICRGLADEKYSAAAQDLWQLALYFDVINDINDGLVMQEALVTLGAIDAQELVPHIVQRLHDFNTIVVRDVESRRRIQRAVVGCVSALEALGDISGFRPVFFTSTGWYEQSVRRTASVALPNIVEDPGEVIIEIIRDPSIVPGIKYEAWREMLRTRASDDSKARVASAALDTGWNYATPNMTFQRSLRELRTSAIDTIRLVGAADNSVYVNLEKSYNNNFINTVPDFDELRKTIATLSALKTPEAVDLLFKFLRELHGRRRVGPWGNKERQLLEWVIPGIGATGTSSMEVRLLLTTIQRSSDYTGNEQRWAQNALRQLGQ